MSSGAESTTRGLAVVLDYLLYRVLAGFVSSNGTYLGASRGALANHIRCQLSGEYDNEVLEKDAPALKARWKAVVLIYALLGAAEWLPVSEERRRRVLWLYDGFRKSHSDVSAVASTSTTTSDTSRRVHACELLVPLFFEVCSALSIGADPHCCLDIASWEALHFDIIASLYRELCQHMDEACALEAATSHGPFGGGCVTPQEYAWTASSEVRHVLARNVARLRDLAPSVSPDSSGGTAALLVPFVSALLRTHARPVLLQVKRPEMFPGNILSAAMLTFKQPDAEALEDVDLDVDDELLP